MFLMFKNEILKENINLPIPPHCFSSHSQTVILLRYERWVLKGEKKMRVNSFTCYVLMVDDM